jgi:hypothetical protein
MIFSWTKLPGKRHLASSLFGVFFAFVGTLAVAQSPTTVLAPLPGSSCTVSALNRNAPVDPNLSFTIFNIPGQAGPFRARATCSDGTVGQTVVAFPTAATEVYTGDIIWGRMDPVPLALNLSAPAKRLTTGQTAQLTATAINENATTRDVTSRLDGTTYAISNDLLGTVTETGLVTILPLFAQGSSSRVVTTAVTEGGASGSFMFILGPRGSLRGKVTRADGSTPVAGAEISVLRTQPREQAGTVITDASGNYQLADVNAGSFIVTVIDPITGDRGQAVSKIENEGDVGSVDVKLNGQGTVVVTVVDGNNAPVTNAQVTLTALGAFLDTRTINTDATGKFSFAGVLAGDVTLSTRDRPSGLVGTILGFLPVGGTLNLTLKLQPVGTISGVVYGVDGSTLQEGVQVRIISRERGIVTQTVTGPDGAFSFNSLPLSDGPFTLDAFADGRLRARVPGLVLNTANQVLTQNLQFVPSGIVTGVVSDSTSTLYPGATLTLQMTEGARYAFNAKADANGRFYFGGIPVGNYTITAAKDARTGLALGRVNTDNENVTTNVQMVTNTLIGKVFQRDGVTPAAGVTVYLVPSRSPLALTINPVAANVLSTTTDAQGKFGFPIPGTDAYTLQAESGLERGRTQAIITTIDPLRPVEVNVTFLAKGTVSGTVKDATGAIQPGVKVDVIVTGAFNNTWNVTADSNGAFTVPGVFVGDIVAVAKNTVTKLAGSATGRLLSEGASININITLAATGSVSGQVLKRDGSLVLNPVKIELVSSYATFGAIEATNGASYKFDLVPIGDFSVVATELSTGDKGISVSRINAASEAKALNVRMVGQGAVRVKVLDDASVPVADAKVTVSTSSPFSTSTTATTNAQGEVVVAKVFAGDFSVSASKDAIIGARSGSANGTLVADQEKAVSITLTNRPVGKVKGVLFAPDGVTPRAGMVIRMTPEPTPNAYRATTDSLGKFEFTNIEGGSSYNINARNFDGDNCYRDRIRAQVTGVQVTVQDEVVVRNLQMISAGRVSGKITGANGAGVGGIRIRIVNPDPIYGLNGGCAGTFYETYSGPDGTYAYPDIPAGDFTITAENAARTLRAEGNGRVRFEADNVKVDLILVDSAVTMPYTLHDANAMPFDIAGDGSVNRGKNSIFVGTGPTSRGMRLDVVVNGIPVPFTNGDGTIGRLGQNGREITVDEDNLASKLKITRKVFVPRTGYFARYLEVLENKTTDPITIGLKVTTHHSQSNSNPRVVDSSDGDQILSVGGAARDRWVVVDDQEDADPFKSGSIPATGHLFDGVGAAKQVDSANYELVGQTGKLNWQWDNITVPPGKTVAVMHFTFNQLNRYDARQAALRLAQMPPEALEALTTDERDAIINFKTPAEGTNTLEPLPTIDAGVIQGKVLSGDGITPIPGAQVHFKSKLALYGKDFYTTADADGNYEFRARADGTASALPVPLYTFDVDTSHPKTQASSANSVGDFVSPATLVSKNLIFNGTGNLRGLVKRHTGGLVNGAYVVLCSGGFINCSAKNYDYSEPDGSYLMSGSLPADYFLLAEKPHPQGGVGIRGRATATITAGDTSVTDITMEETGTVTGIVRTAGGTPVENAEVTLSGVARNTRTDTAGRYRFVDVPVGEVRVDGKDPTSGALGSGTGTVTVNQESTVDFSLKGFGTVNVQINFARGIPAPDASFFYNGDKYGSGTADAAGKANASVPVGNYMFTASHPDDNSNLALRGSAAATLAQNGESVNILITLKAAGAVKGTILRPDGSTLAGGFPYTLKLINGATATQVKTGNTNATGQYRSAGLALGLYVLTAYDSAQDRFADAEFDITADGQEMPLDLIVQDNRIALPADLYDANRFRFDVQQPGQFETGHFWTFDQGGAKLEINGLPFAGDTSALLEANRRQFAITQPQTIAGLKVTRKIFVPRGSYFARYLEVFENPTAAPIVLDAKVTSNYGAAQIISSSTGDTALTTTDNWAVVDDATNADPFIVDGQQPATAHVFANAGATKAIDQASFLATAGTKHVLTQRWSNLSVPAGGKVVVMHFVVQQVHQAGAKASAERLAQLPPEAIQSLTKSELQAIVNFAVPQDGVGTVDPLPALTGSASGRVFEGDGRTGVARVSVTVQSAHPLFNRVWGMNKDPSPFCTMAGTAETSLHSASTGTTIGSYSMSGRLTNTDSIAMPEGVDIRIVAQEPQGCFSTYAGHSWTGIPSKQYVKPASVTQDVLFDSGILTGTISGYQDLQTTSGRMYLSIDNPDYPDFRYIPLQSDGTYVYPGITPGTYDVLADVPHPHGSGLRGARITSIVTLANTTVTDVQLQPAGIIQGATLTANGEASVNARVQLVGAPENQAYDQCATGCVAETLPKHKGKRGVTRETRTDSLGRFNFATVPVGAYTATVTDPISDGKKQVSLVVTENQVTVQNITLLPVGTVQLAVKLPNGQPAVDAYVYMYADAQGFEETSGRTSAQGLLTVANIPQGNFTIRVRDPRRINDSFYDRKVSGTIATNGEIQQQTIVLFAAVNLKITTVDGDKSNTVLPATNVYLQDARSGKRYVGVTDTQGVLTVNDVPQGAFTIELSKQLEGTTAIFTISGEVLVADDTQAKNVSAPIRRTVGSVRATVVDKDTNNTPIANANVYVVDANRVSRTYVGNTDSNGQIFIPGIALGSFTITARATVSSALQEAEAAGSITPANIAQTQEVRPEFKSTLVPLPRTLYDANNFPFDIQANGSVDRGRYYYYGSFNGGASILEVNGTAFTGGAQAKLEAGTRQLAITQQQIAGLDVTRKVFVPREGYFARYLEVFDNRTSSPITVNAKVTHKYYNRSVISTSSGDASVQNTDNWVTIDDGTNTDPFVDNYTEASTAHVHGQAGAVKALDAAVFETDNTGYYTYNGSRLVQNWNQITVPANGRIALMHFVVQQTTRESSKASAERLVQLPREAIDNLTPDEIASVVNFTIPSNGQSVVAPLPALTGLIEGKALEGDATSPVLNATVKVKSTHPLFGRTWLSSTDLNGKYSVIGQINDTGNSVSIPVGVPVTISSTHPQTQILSSALTAAFPDAATSITQNVVFPTGQIAGNIISPADYPVTGGNHYVQVTRNGNSVAGTFYVKPDGSYVVSGVIAGTYQVRLTAYHPQGTSLKGVVDNVLVNVGSMTTLNIPVEPTGSVSGVLKTAAGAPVSNQQVTLTSTSGTIYRYAYPDAQGQYSFTAVPIGSYILSTVDSRNGATVTSALSVSQGQNFVANLTLLGVASVQISVKYARGTPAQYVQVYLRAVGVTNERYVGSTDANGQLTAFVPVGSFTVRTMHPQSGYSAGYTTSTGTVSADGEVIPLSLTLKALANVKVTVVNADNANAPIAGTIIYLTDARVSDQYWTSTDGSGQATISGVLEGSYQISARTATGGRFGVSGVITVADDNTTIQKTISVTAKFDELGTLTFEGERRLYSVALTGSASLKAIAYGDAGTNQTALSVTRLTAYDSAKSLLASGYAYAGQSGYPYSTSGNLSNISATGAGNYTLAIESYSQSGSASLGSFRIVTLADGQQVDVLPYAGGGTVQGVAYQSDGTTPAANQVVSLKTLDALALNTRTTTNAAGEFKFENVPLADFRLAVMDGTEIASATGSLSSTTLPVVQNLTIFVSSPISLELQNANGIAYGSGLPVTVTDQSGKRDLVTDPNGKVVFTGYGLVNVLAIDPNGGGVASTTVQAAIGQSFTLTLKTNPISVSGRVTYPDGSPANMAQLTLITSVPSTRYYYVTTSANGEYVFSNLTSTGAARVNGQNQFAGFPSSRNIIVPSTGGALIGQDLVLPGSGTVKAVLKDGAGIPIAYAYVYATWTDPNPCAECSSYGQGYFYTDDSGSFSTSAIYNGVSGGTLPIGIPVTISACNNSGYACISRTETLANHGQVLDFGTIILAETSIQFTVTTPVGPAPTAYTQLVGRRATNEDCYSGYYFGYVQKGGQETLTAIASNAPNMIGFIACQNGAIVAESNTPFVSGQNSIVIMKTTALSISLTDAAGNVPNIPFQVYLKSPSSPANDAGDYLGAIIRGGTEIFIADAIAMGEATREVRATANNNAETAAKRTITIQSGQLNLAELKVSLIRAQAKYSDGTLVPDAYVAAQVVENNVVGNYTGAQALSTTLGSFEVYAAAIGEVELIIQDSDSSLFTKKRVQVTSNTVPVSVDVTLPASGTVTGIVKNARGLVESGASVGLSNKDVSRQTSTDATGRYTFTHVGLGDFSIEVSSAGLESAIATGNVASDGQTVDVPISLLAPATVTGRVLNGASGEANGEVHVESVAVSPNTGLRSVNALADGTGSFSVTAPLGQVRVVVAGSSYETPRGIALVNLTATGVNGLDVPLANAVGFTYDFYSSSNRYSLKGDLQGAESYKNGCEGTVSETLYADFGAVYMPCSFAAAINTDGDELTFGPFVIKNIEYSRRVYVPKTGATYARVVDTFRNVGNINQVSSYYLSTPETMNSDAIQIVTRGNGSGGYNPYRQLVKHGAGKPVTYVDNVLKALAVPTGGSLSIMSYMLARESCNTEGASTATCTIPEADQLSSALFNGTHPGMFKGLTAADRSSLINFNVPN